MRKKGGKRKATSGRPGIRCLFALRRSEKDDARRKTDRK